MYRKELTLKHRLNYTRYARFIHCLSTEILLQAFEWLYKGKSMTLKEFYDKNPAYFVNMSEYFLRDIRGGKQPKEMDFSGVYKLLQSVCGLANPNQKIWFKEAQKGTDTPLENALYHIKTMRNKFSHPNPENFMELSDQDLDTSLKQLLSLFENVLTSSAKKAGINNKKLKKAIYKMNEDLRKERYSDDSIANEEFMKICLEELSDQISNCPKTLYLKPRLEEQLTDEKVECQSKSIDCRQSKIFMLNVLFDRQTFTKQSPKVLLVSGSTGSGKTSLCRFLEWDWLSKSTSVRHLGKYDLVLSLTCKNITTRDLLYLLRSNLLPKATALLDALQLSTFLKGHRILWLVDGWDEAKEEAKILVSDLVMKVEQEWICHTVLITSRPHQSSEILYFSNRDTLLKFCLLGIDESEQRELLQLHSKGSPKLYDCNSIKKFLNIVDKFDINVKEDLKNPLKFLLIFRIWAENSSRVITGSLSSLYDAIKDSHEKRLIIKLRERDFPPDNNSEFLEDAISTWLKELSKVTFASLIRNEGLFLSSQDIKTLQNVCRRPSLASHCLSTFLEYHQQTNNIESNQYSYLHPSQKIFFASLHLVNILNESKTPEQRLDEIFQQNISRFEFSNVIDPFLGVYDILSQIQLIILSIVSKVSNGFLWPHLRSQHIGSLLKSTFMKVIDIQTNFYTKQKPNLYSSYEFFSVLLSTLEIQSVKYGLDRWPIRSFFKVIYSSISEESKSSQWFEVLRICQYNQYVLQDIIQYIDTQEWQVSDTHLKSAWELMCYVVPQKILINISGDPKRLPDLDILLNLVKKHRIEVQLNLLQQLCNIGGHDQSDIYLEILCNRDSHCILTHFSGYLNRQNLHILQKASYLHAFSIRITDSQTVKQIPDTTRKLKYLKAVSILYDLKSYPYIDKPLKVKGYFGIFLRVNVIFPYLHETNVKSAAKFICQFCENYLTIQVGNLGKKGIREISSILTEKRVTVNNLCKPIYLDGLARPTLATIGFINVNNRTLTMHIN